MLDGALLNNRYRLLARLGEGGMATVFRAEDTKLGRIVAVKVLHEHLGRDAAFLARFEAEARAAASLSHPNIVAVYDVGYDAGEHYIVMEFVEGPTLKELIAGSAPFPVRRAVDLTTQILAALELAHQRGIVHRDIKPQNVLVTADGRAKVADFGIARLQAATAQTQAGEVFGTPDYMAPERASGREAGAAADVYSVGVVLYEMLTGRLPFTGESAIEVALKHLQEPPPPPSRLNPAVPPGLEEVVLQALAKDPAQRFASASAMRQALAQYETRSSDTTGRLVVPSSWPATPVTAGAVTAAPAISQARRSGCGYLLVISFLLLVTVALAAGVFSVARPLYDAYFRSGLATPPPTAAPAVLASATPAPTPTGTPVATPTATLTPTPAITPTSTPTATPTPRPTNAPAPAPPTATPLPPAVIRFAVAQKVSTMVKTPKDQLGEVQGQIVDQQGQLVPGLRLKIVSEGGWTAYRPRPGIDVADGTYRFDQLSPGRYSVTIVDEYDRPISETATDLVMGTPPNFKGYSLWTVDFRQTQ